MSAFVEGLPALHPAAMADCWCGTGQEHARRRQEAWDRWGAAYEKLPVVQVCGGCAGWPNAYHAEGCGR